MREVEEPEIARARTQKRSANLDNALTQMERFLSEGTVASSRGAIDSLSSSAIEEPTLMASRRSSSLAVDDTRLADLQRALARAVEEVVKASGAYEEVASLNPSTKGAATALTEQAVALQDVVKGFETPARVVSSSTSMPISARLVEDHEKISTVARSLSMGGFRSDSGSSVSTSLAKEEERRRKSVSNGSGIGV